MIRRLLTCLALITGLAAAGAPANAAVMEALSEQVSSASSAALSGKSARVECNVQCDADPIKGDPLRACKRSEPVVIYIPTIQFGADRAYE